MNDATTSGRRCANSGVNHRETTDSEMAAQVPAARTVAARSRHIRAGGRWALVQSRASRSTRSGAWIASHIPTMPPRESPA